MAALNIDETVEQWATWAADAKYADPRFAATVEVVASVVTGLISGAIALLLADRPILALFAAGTGAGIGAWVAHRVLHRSLYTFYRFKAPLVQRDDARQEVRRLRSEHTGLSVYSSYPVVHLDGDGRRYLIIPLLQISNLDNASIDLDVDAFVLIEGLSFTLGLPLEDERIDVDTSLNKHQRAGGQMAPPVQIPGGSRARGYAVFDLGEHEVDMELSNLERVTISLTDGVKNVLLKEEEVWPDIWPGIFAQQTLSELPMIPLEGVWPTQQPSPDTPAQPET